ncbi:unnamed protein product, partial [Ixodes hexagonus]
VRRLNISLEAPSYEEMEKKFTHVMKGGRFKPTNCRARHRVAILVPYRNRPGQLPVLLYNMHQMLPRQQIDYGIFTQEGKFNRAKLFNIGYLESLALYDYDCFIFHDVDLIPEDDRNLYTCPDKPRHMSVVIDTTNYRINFPKYFGGVSALRKEHMQTVNGFSNLYWGWGGEDNDMSERLRYHRIYFIRYPDHISKYTMQRHRKEIPNPERFTILEKRESRYKTDGLNSLNYERKALVLKRLYTWILADLKAPK